MIILPHLYTESSPWEMEFRIFKSTHTSPIKTITVAFSPEQPSIRLKELIDEVCLYVSEKYPIEQANPLFSVNQVTATLFAHYVNANESCLAISLACNIENGQSTLYGERNIFDKLLILALEEPNSDIPKLMLISAMAKSKAYQSTIYQEYQRKLERLLEEQVSRREISTIFKKNLNDIYGN